MSSHGAKTECCLVVYKWSVRSLHVVALSCYIHLTLEFLLRRFQLFTLSLQDFEIVYSAHSFKRCLTLCTLRRRSVYAVAMRTMLMASFGWVALIAVQCSCLTSAEYALVNNPSAEDVTGIQQSLGLFAVAIDLKQFDLLDVVFSANATANFTGHSVIVGVSTIKAYLSKGLAGLKSQHNLGSLYINMTGPDKATSYNWLHGTFFGTGNASGQTFSNFGYYKDDLVRTRGHWYIQNRGIGAFVSAMSISLSHSCIVYMDVVS